ncbi:hypothetical protein Tco_0222014 [Tanacetum coccineum]
MHKQHNCQRFKGSSTKALQQDDMHIGGSTVLTIHLYKTKWLMPYGSGTFLKSSFMNQKKEAIHFDIDWNWRDEIYSTVDACRQIKKCGKPSKGYNRKHLDLGITQYSRCL